MNHRIPHDDASRVGSEQRGWLVPVAIATAVAAFVLVVQLWPSARGIEVPAIVAPPTLAPNVAVRPAVTRDFVEEDHAPTF